MSADNPLEVKVSLARLGRLNTVLAAVVVILVVLAAAVFIGGARVLPWTTPAEAASADYDEVKSVAEDGVIAFLDVDYRDMDSRVKKVLALSTGTFKNQYQTASADLKTQVQAARTVATSGIVRVGVGDIDADTAVVYVAADTEVSNTAIEKEKAAGKKVDGRRYYRFQLTMSRVGDHWLLSDLQGIS